MGYPPIEAHGLIGDLSTAALVGLDGSIDFLAFPRFDAPTIFAALLDDERGGRFRLSPVLECVDRRQIYLPDTAVLFTRFLSDDGVAEISDFMPIGGDGCVVRRAKCIRGRTRFRLELSPRFGYGQVGHRVHRRRVDEGAAVVFDAADGTGVHFESTVPLRVRAGDVFAEFELGPGESETFVLSRVPESGEPVPHEGPWTIAAFKATVNFWRRWLRSSNYRGRWQDVVHRSAITLKLLTSARYGSLVAAPTFSLPESLEGQRNWDYRYTWVRDTALALAQLLDIGFVDEAAAFMGWLGDRADQGDGDGPLRVLYRLDGQHDLGESTLDLHGWKGARPVRVGNGAQGQLQLDIYGELMDAVYLYDRVEPVSHDQWQSFVRMLDWLSGNWRRPDDGIWEFRAGSHEFLSSRFMCWVAFDRAIRMARRRSRPAPLDAWHKTRDAIYRNVFEDFWNPEREAFTQHPGAHATDASTLLMPLYHVIAPRDPRWLSTMRAIGEDLVCDAFVYRYRSEQVAADGFQSREGTFSACSFWWTECLARGGDVDQARFLFEKMLGYATPTGLYAEELGTRGQHMGNFPQGLTHLALIGAARYLDKALNEQGKD